MANYKTPCDDDHYPKENDHKEHGGSNVVLSCGTGSGLTLPVNGALLNGSREAVIGGSYGSPGLVVGTVSLDARGLEDPTIKIDFSSLINFKANLLIGFEFRLIYQLSKTCDNGQKIPLSSWIFEKELDVELGTTLGIPQNLRVNFEFKEPFDFVWCECESCGGCCVYTVEVIDIYTYNIECASITNVGLTALAVGK